MNTFTPEILRCLAHGLYDLNKGDESWLACAETVKKQVFAATGLVYSGHAWTPAAETYTGYYAGGEHAYVDGSGQWRGAAGLPVMPGAQLYLDRECTIPTRVTT